MIVAGNAEIRRLRTNRVALFVIVALLGGALYWNDPTVMFVVVCGHTLLWAMMLLEAHRELAQISSPIDSSMKAKAKEVRMD